MHFTYRPLPAIWPSGERTPWNRRKHDKFRASWTNTLDLLHNELDCLGCAGTVVIEAGYREQDIRLDGLPRANARLEDPAAILNIDSKFGPLRYGCDTYHDHQANVRAIALALEALRAVDRYGVTKRGEQYTGWKALPAGEGQEPPISTRAEALAFMAELSGLPRDADPKQLYRAAVRIAHPDSGGSHESFVRLQQAKEVLGL